MPPGDPPGLQPDLTQSPAYRTHRERERELQNRLRVKKAGYTLLFVIAVIVSGIISEVRLQGFIDFPGGFARYIGRTIPEMAFATLGADIAEWFWGFRRWAFLLFETVIMGFLATVLGALTAFTLCFTASRNLARRYSTYFLTRRLFEIWRAVPDIVYALIFVFAFGLGPLAGILAIAIHSAGALGKLYSEVNENVDVRSLEGVRATGANWAQTMIYGVVPQVMPNFLSYTLLRFEINVRSAAIIGFVGAGGIGQELFMVIRQFIYSDVSAIMIMIIVVVSVIDISCEKMRHRIIAPGEGLK